MKLREIVYMVLDQLKLHSDDASFTEDHIVFLAKNYRTFLLKQRYSDVKKEIPEANYQEICVNLEPYSSTDTCGEQYLRSIEDIPSTLTVGNSSVHLKDFYQGIHIAFVNKERMKYVGHNKYLQNIIYCSLNDGHLYLQSTNPQFKYLKQVQMTGLFEDSEAAANLSCDSDEEDGNCDILDKDFPLESALVPPLIELIVKELTVAEYKPEDQHNNDSDDLSKVTTNAKQ